MGWQTGNPEIRTGECKEFFVAVRYETYYRDKGVHEVVLQLQYCNRPLKYDEDGELIELDYYHMTEDGEPISAVGWYHREAHHDFDGYYTEICKDWEVLAWQPVVAPSFLFPNPFR